MIQLSLFKVPIQNNIMSRHYIKNKQKKRSWRNGTYEQAVSEGGEEQVPLTVRNLVQNQAQGGRPSASSSLVGKTGSGCVWERRRELEDWEKYTQRWMNDKTFCLREPA